MNDTTDWDPDLYARFEAMRSAPFWELAGLIEPGEPIDRMADLGCGSGELTIELASRLGVRETVGIDSSPAMLERAASHGHGRPGAGAGNVTFHAGDIGVWTGHDLDLIVANASLQWVPDHPAVLERWCSSLRVGGRLLVQVPSNADHPSHMCSATVAAREPFLSALGGAPPPDPVAANVLAPEQYAALLYRLGIDEPVVRLVVYPQVMPSSASVVDWVSGTSLTRFFARLPSELHAPFVDAYRDELLAAIGDHRPYLYCFKRVLMGGRLTRRPDATA